MALCSHCAQLLREGGSQGPHAALMVVGDGSGTVGGRKIESSLLECSECRATWQRETDSQTLRQIWYLRAG